MRSSAQTTAQFTLSLMLLSFAVSSSGAEITLSMPSHGTELEQTSSFYDPFDQTIEVRGAIAGIPSGTLGDYQVLLNGFGASIVSGGGGIVNFAADVAIGPLPPPGLGGWPTWIPYVHQFSNTEALYLPVLAELYHIPSMQVVSRFRVIVIDKRWDDDMNMKSSGALSESAAFELTNQGLTALQSPHKSSLPNPSLDEFNDALTAEFAGESLSLPTNTNYGSSTKACVGVDTVAGLTETSAYKKAFLAAQTQLTMYKSTKQTCQSAPNPIIQAAACVAERTFCVREQPREDRFEVCVSDVAGTGRELAIEGVNDVQLGLGQNVTIEAINELKRVSGGVDVELQNLFVRWNVDHFGCVSRPKADLEEAERLDNGTVAQWSSCPVLDVDAYRAESVDPLVYEVKTSTDPERLEVNAQLVASDVFEFPPVPQTDLATTTCAEEFVSADAETLLGEFYGVMNGALDTVWQAEHPDTQQAVALDQLLSRYETGRLGDMTDVELDLDIVRIESTEDRILGKYNSAARLRPFIPVFTGAEFVHSPRSDFPCEGGALPSGSACSDSRNFYGNEFDVSYSLTTGTLNQVIGERFPTASMFSALQPSCEDLGMASGCATDDLPELDGTTLVSLHSALASLGSTKVTIELKPTMVPFTWIHPDPPVFLDTGRGNLTYQLGQYQVDFVGDSLGPDGTNIWLSVIVDFFAPSLELDIAREEGSNEIVAALGNDTIWYATIMKSQLTGCPLMPHRSPSVGVVPLPCEGELTSAVSDLVEPVLTEALHAMISQHPAPQMFDADGQAKQERVFTQTDKFQWGQVITLYGELE
ncbi:MAG: hypothetical protein AAF918_14590 [Pseudomonadota bacterium]